MRQIQYKNWQTFNKMINVSYKLIKLYLKLINLTNIKKLFCKNMKKRERLFIKSKVKKWLFVMFVRQTQHKNW